MPSPVMISLDPRSLDSGSPEGCATFGQLTIRSNGDLLTYGIEAENNTVCDGPYVSGYALAEWFVWNWWRIMWETSGSAPGAPHARLGWALAHHINTAGDGYAWPCVEIASDGKYVTLISRPSMETHGTLFRYLGSRYPQIVPVGALQKAIDGFVRDMLSRLEDKGVENTNLHHLWRDLKQERQQNESARYRKLEATLGYDADEVDEAVISDRMADADRLGDDALAELTATETDSATPHEGRSWSREIEDRAKGGFDMNAGDALCLANSNDMPLYGHIQAWKFGENLAQALRQQENLGDQCIQHDRLAAFAGTVDDIITFRPSRAGNISFVLNEDNGSAKVTLRPKWVTGRRFELARLIGDHIVHTQIENTNERLYPATVSHSYRQKMQRAFAAEFLCPFQAIKTMVGDNPSEEEQTEVAKHFKVSEMTVRAQLVNNNLLPTENAPDIVGRGSPHLAFN